LRIFSTKELLTDLLLCSSFVLMSIESIGEAYSLGWRVIARCKYGRPDGAGPKSSRECGHRRELDMETLVWTRGRAFAFDDPGIGSLFAIEGFCFAVDDDAAFLDDDLGGEGPGAVFASSPYYRAHRDPGIILMLNGFCALSYRCLSA
jgi:hypothetical protein